jgi:hypothetical protein
MAAAQRRFMEITVETTAAAQTTLLQLMPLPLFDGSLRSPSGSALELVKPSSSTVLAEITYLRASGNAL